MKNIENFIKVKKDLKSATPLLNFHYILCKENQHEALQFLDLVKSLDTEVAEVLYTPLLHGFKEIKRLEMSRNKTLELKEKIIDKSKKIGVNIEFNECMLDKKPSICYCANWIMPFIFVTGEVVACCTMNEGNRRDRQKKYSMGNVYKQSFKDIWYGPQFTAFRKKIRQGKTPKYCEGCPIYQCDKE